MSFYDYFNDGQRYLCDRCNITELREDEFLTNKRNQYIYCDECWNFIHKIFWKCLICQSTGTIRTEREYIEKKCCGKIVEFLKW